MDALELLTRDHREVDEAFDEFESRTDPERRTKIARQVIAELSTHAGIEEAVFYPTVKEALPELAEEIDHDLQEHQQPSSCWPTSTGWIAARRNSSRHSKSSSLTCASTSKRKRGSTDPHPHAPDGRRPTSHWGRSHVSRTACVTPFRERIGKRSVQSA